MVKSAISIRTCVKYSKKKRSRSEVNWLVQAVNKCTYGSTQAMNGWRVSDKSALEMVMMPLQVSESGTSMA